uniref:Endonuclease/exonuclease/phosphatase domain-containing protein n=1 Tax=Cuerna arida TaxID=1464854 RepID=A0A1B6EQI2_9HEMI
MDEEKNKTNKSETQDVCGTQLDELPIEKLRVSEMSPILSSEDEVQPEDPKKKRLSRGKLRRRRIEEALAKGEPIIPWKERQMRWEEKNGAQVKPHKKADSSKGKLDVVVALQGECLLDFIAEYNLIIMNQGRKPTFVHRRGTGVREEVLDITLASNYIATKVLNWMVLDETLASDHSYISFNMRSNKINETYRNPKKTDWVAFNAELRSNLERENGYQGQGVDDVANLLQHAIKESYHKACPETEKNSRKKAC